jgi:hypothetical protein
MTRSLSYAAILSICLLLSASAYAHSGVLLNFQGIGDLQQVGSFYDGAGPAGAQNFGVTFSSNFFGLRSVFNGGSGEFSATPTGTPAIFMNGTTGMQAMGVMNDTQGFSSGINFYYTAGFTANQFETVTVWSGANGSGTVLATITLANNNSACSSPTYCTWSSDGVNFSGTARSVTFSGPGNELGLADITLGSNTTAVPEPSSIYLLGSGLAGISFFRIRRFLGV